MQINEIIHSDYVGQHCERIMTTAQVPHACKFIISVHYSVLGLSWIKICQAIICILISTISYLMMAGAFLVACIEPGWH